MWKRSIYLLLCALLFSNSINAVCPNGVRPRKEIRDLTEAEWTAYATAVIRLQQGSSPTPWDRQTQLHLTEQDTVHGNSFFLPWHRYYIYQLEIKLQAIDSSVMLHYWNWPYDSQAPETSEIFGSTRYGGNGGGSEGCVSSGSFSGSRVNLPNSHCLTRQWDGTTRITSFYSVDLMNAMITSSGKNYTNFRLQLEVAHNGVHSSIGGDMGTVASPNDPLFYAHHGFIDKMWSQWQATHGSTEINGVDSRGRNVVASTVLPSYPSIRVSNTFSTTELCYTYQDMTWTRSASSSVPAAATAVVAAAAVSNTTRLVRRATNPTTYVDPLDRTELVNLRQPKPVPDDILRRNHIDVAAARGIEKKFANIIARINSIVGYIPPSCLWLREDSLSKLLDQTSEFVAAINGVTYKVKTPKSGSTSDKLHAIRETLHKEYGGNVRADPSKYIDLLRGVVGNLVFSKKDASYELTLPGKDPSIKASA